MVLSQVVLDTARTADTLPGMGPSADTDIS